MRRIVAVVVALLLLGAVGCGGSSKSQSTKTVSQAEIAKKGDAICRKLNQRRTAKPPQFNPATATPAQVKSMVPFLQQTADEIRASADQVRALGKPDKNGRLLDKLLADARTSTAGFQAAAKAAAKGDAKTVRATFGTLPDDSRLARQFGFKVCAQQG